MIPAPKGFMYPSRLVECLEIDMFDDWGAPLSPYWAASIPSESWQGIEIEITNFDLLEMALVHATSHGLFAWDKRSEPFLIENKMPCGGSYPKCLLFDAKTNIIQPNRSSMLSAHDDGSGEMEEHFTGIEAHCGLTALFSEHKAHNIIYAIRSGTWEEQANMDAHAISRSLLWALMPMPLHSAIWAHKITERGTRGGHAANADLEPVEKRAALFDALPMEELHKMTAKPAAEMVDKAGLSIGKKTIQRDLREAKKRRPL